MASKVTIKIPKNFSSQSEFITIKLASKQLENIARDTEKKLKEQVQQSIQRPNSSGNLANSMFAERVNDLKWGVGNISFLNKNAPYWRWINFGVAKTGRRIPPPVRGTFSPGDPAPNSLQFQSGRFEKDDSGFLIIPNKPIQPHNFIARTLAEVPKIISSVLNRIKR